MKVALRLVSAVWWFVLPQVAISQAQPRPVTVADSIEMTRFGGPTTELLDVPRAVFSPDSSRFVIVTRHGNISQNTNEYTLLLFRTAKVFESPQPETLVTLASDSNDPAIDKVRWLADSETLLFLGEKRGDIQRIYSLNVRTHRLRQLTKNNTSIVSFDSTGDLRTIVYVARPPIKNLFDDRARFRGLVITNQLFADLLSGHTSDVSNDFLFSPNPYEVFVQRLGQSAKRIFLDPDLPPEGCVPSIAPDGRHTAVQVFAGRFPEIWKGYDAPLVREAVFQGAGELYRYVLIDNDTGSSHPLFEAPSTTTTLENADVAWSSDSRFVVVGGTFLPIGIADPEEEKIRRSDAFAVELDLQTGRIEKLAQGEFHILQWDMRTNSILLQPAAQRLVGRAGVLAFQKKDNSWVKASSELVDRQSPIQVVDQQDMTTPPRLVAIDAKSDKQAVVLDPNRQFQNLLLGHVEQIEWKGKDGQTIEGGLYFPTDYQPGRKYPLVIQTHGWYPQRFLLDGPSTSGYAAQELAGHGFVVAQTADGGYTGDCNEGPWQMGMIEGLIAELAGRGLVDSARIGLLGFSRTGYGVRYALAFSRFRFGAAVIADGMDGSYMQYLTWLNADQQVKQYGNFYEQLNCAPAVGDGLRSWFQHATGFNLDKVHTPVRLLGFRPYSLQSNWEWFVGLKNLGKPVESIWLPEAAHNLIRPLERLTAQEGDVDWFRFWLKGEEDSNPSKDEQYMRWREMRNRQPTLPEMMN